MPCSKSQMMGWLLRKDCLLFRGYHPSLYNHPFGRSIGLIPLCLSSFLVLHAHLQKQRRNLHLLTIVRGNSCLCPRRGGGVELVPLLQLGVQDGGELKQGWTRGRWSDRGGDGRGRCSSHGIQASFSNNHPIIRDSEQDNHTSANGQREALFSPQRALRSVSTTRGSTFEMKFNAKSVLFPNPKS